MRQVGAVLPAVRRAKRPFLRADSGRVEVLGEAAGRTGGAGRARRMEPLELERAGPLPAGAQDQ